jgi:hypothetical protein
MQNRGIYLLMLLMILFACIPPDYWGMPKVLFQSDGDWKRNIKIDRESLATKISGICSPKKGLEISFRLEIESKADNRLSISKDDIRMLCDEFKLIDFYKASEKANRYWLKIQSIESYDAISERIHDSSPEITCSYKIENIDISPIFIEFRIEKNEGIL